MITAATVRADWMLCVKGAEPLTNGCPVPILRFDQWRSDDVQDWVKAGRPVPNQFPAVVHIPSKAVANSVTSVADGQARCQALMPMLYGGTNVVADWSAALSNAVAVTGGKRSLAGLKNAGKNIPTSQERAYYMATVDALVARIQILEATLRAAGLCPPATITGDEP